MLFCYFIFEFLLDPLLDPLLSVKRQGSQKTNGEQESKFRCHRSTYSSKGSGVKGLESPIDGQGDKILSTFECPASHRDKFRIKIKTGIGPT